MITADSQAMILNMTFEAKQGTFNFSLIKICCFAQRHWKTMKSQQHEDFKLDSSSFSLFPAAAEFPVETKDE